MKSKILGLLTASVALAGMTTVHAVPVTYSTDASFLAAAGGGLTFESFESATQSGTTVTFSGGTFSCSGSSYCPGFFGVTGSFADTGAQSVFFASPDSATFTFGSAITAFGLAIGGAGDVAALTLTALLSNGSSVTAVGPNHTGPFTVFQAGDRLYFGVIDLAGFSSITFTPNSRGDGIFFDSLSYGTAGTSVPEPGTLALLGLGLAGLGLSRRRKAN